MVITQQVKNLPEMQGTHEMQVQGSIPRLERSPGGGKWLHIPVFLIEKSHGQRGPAGYSPKGHKEPDMTEELNPLFATA